MSADESSPTAGAPLSAHRSIVVISDFRDGWPPADRPAPSVAAYEAAWRAGERGPPPGPRGAPGSLEDERARLAVVGGYLERLPLACIKAGLADCCEIWHHFRPATPPPFVAEAPLLSRRAFHLDGEQPPFASNDMLGFVQAFGAPHILCVWGLGVDAALLRACRRSVKIYNSIDAPAIRVPHAVASQFDLVLTAAEWQSDEVRRDLPGMPCAVLPIGPEFADPETFRPLHADKPYDVVYVAAAQPYKRHDILFDALARLPRDLRALCVFGYGDMSGELRQRAADAGLQVDFVGPPGVPFAEVNRLMNSARMGVVCGVDDGAPAILTEYMLAGLPVLANSALRCGLQYITPATGLVASAAEFHHGIRAVLDRAAAFAPRETVLQRWTWPHTVARLARLLREHTRER